MVNLYLSADYSWDEALHALSREWRAEKSRRDDRERILHDDDYLSQWAKRHGMGLLGRAGWYKKQHYEFIKAHGFFNTEDPRRPVGAPGSKYCLYKKYSNSRYGSAPNGWCEAVLHRYLKMTRYTCFEADEHWHSVSDLMLRLRKKHGVNWKSSQGDSGGVRESYGNCWINGNQYNGLTSHQFSYLRKLWNMSNKLDLIDRKINVIKLPG